MQDITVHLNAKLQPMHRFELEDALVNILEDIGISANQTGGGSAIAENGEIESCDIEMTIDGDIDSVTQKIIAILETMLAPYGSQIIIYPTDESEEVKKIPFGAHEGLGLYLNGKDLDDEVYKNCDVNYVYTEIERLLGDFSNGHIASYWEGEETALYLYGPSFDTMHEMIKPLLDNYPLCEKCKVKKIA